MFQRNYLASVQMLLQTEGLTPGCVPHMADARFNAEFRQSANEGGDYRLRSVVAGAANQLQYPHS
jgi:hypothetical protein